MYELRDGIVHIWKASLDVPGYRLSDIKKTLSDDEIKRAERFYFEKDKVRFIAHRGFLRNVLSLYLNLLPSMITFGYEESGKPFIPYDSEKPPLFFNSSHSNNISLFAVSGMGPIGVDIEYIRSITDMKLLAKRFFAPEEYEMIISLPGETMIKKFFAIWNLKEAYLKATGEGLSGLEHVRISFDDQNDPIISYKKETLSVWRGTCFTPFPNYCGAMVIKAHKPEVIFRKADISAFG